ncbi:Gamma tubulin, partial [Spraguea lophii 42_110]
SYTPFISPENRILRKSNCSDIMQRLLLHKTKMASFELSKTQSIISALNIFSGVENPSELQTTIIRTFDKDTLKFVPWMPPSFHAVIAPNPTISHNRVSALSLTNTTATANLIKKISEQYDKLKKRNAFIDMYKRFNEDLSMFDESREVVQNVINEYENAELASYTFN